MLVNENREYDDSQKPSSTVYQENSPVDCVIVGGGPAGLVLGYLLARASVKVTVLEKHDDFNRDFRGDNVHPSTMQVLDDLGLIEEFLKLNVDRMEEMWVNYYGTKLCIADYSRCTGGIKYKFMGIVPQYEFLDFLASKAKEFNDFFQLKMSTVATSLIRDEQEKVIGVMTEKNSGTSKPPASQLSKKKSDETPYYAQLVVCCDGRHSKMRAKAGLVIEEFSQLIDVLWVKLYREDEQKGGEQKPLVSFSNPQKTASSIPFLNVFPGGVCVILPRKGYYQTGWSVPKGMMEQMRSQDITCFQEMVGEKVPELKEMIKQIKSWDQVPELVVRQNCISGNWYIPGLLCIGDAAHAMSPVGGVGINVAIMDAVAAFNILRKPLLAQCVLTQDLQKVQARRLPCTKRTQAVQGMQASKIQEHALTSSVPNGIPWIWRFTHWCPCARGLFARIMHHVTGPERPDLTFEEKKNR